MQSNNPRRRWSRFSLRTLLLLITVSSALFGWLGVKVRQAERQRAAAQAIEKMGGLVLYDYQFDSSDNKIEAAIPPGPIWLRKWFGNEIFAKVCYVELISWNGDAELIHLAGLGHLEVLSELKWLYLANRQLTDSGLRHLQGLSQLEYLYLGFNQVGDAGLVYLERLDRLKELDLGFSQVGDAGLVHLQGLTQLKELDLRETHVTDAGCQELQKALPYLEIIR